MKQQTNAIPRMKTVDQGGWSVDRRHPRVAVLTAWLITGFIIGTNLTLILGLVILPALVSDFSIRRRTVDASNPAVAYVLVSQTPTATATRTQTPLPSDTPTVTATPTEIPPTLTPTPGMVMTLARPFSPATATIPPATATPRPAPVSYELTGIAFHQQGWNNCGPANLAMGLSFYGWQVTQEDTAEYLKPQREDRNVSPQQMVDYVNRFTDLNAIWRMGGDWDQIRWLVGNEFVVIVQTGYDPGNGEGWYGHYETVVGYDQERITVYDSYMGRPNRPQLTRAWPVFDRDWQQFNRNFIVIYAPQREAELRAFLGIDWSEHENWRLAAEAARQEALVDPENPFVWFNYGTSLTAVGRYEEAVVAFARAFEFNSLSSRMMWYQFGPYEALIQTGRLSEALSLANTTLQSTKWVEETYYYKGRVFEIQGDYEAAIEQYDLALDQNPNYTPSRVAKQRVENFLQ